MVLVIHVVNCDISCCTAIVRSQPSHCQHITLSSRRQHLGYDDCLEDKREDYQNCSVLYCVIAVVHSNMHTQNEQFLKMTAGLGLLFVCLSVCFN